MSGIAFSSWATRIRSWPSAARRALTYERSPRPGVIRIPVSGAELQAESSPGVPHDGETCAMWKYATGRWVRQARAGEGLDRRPRERFLVTDEIRRRVALWRGNVAAVHRELSAAAKAGGALAPGLSTLQRAVARGVLAGDRAGLGGGERARRTHDVFLQRRGTHRNAAWEAGHVEVAVEVDAGGRLVKLWVTWLVDAAANVVCGAAVTPGAAPRESILAALRSMSGRG
jgi:putative transposase